MLEFDATPLCERICINSVEYMLKECTEDDARKFRNACARGAKMADGKVIGVDGIADVQSLLLSMCLFEILPDGTVKNVPVTLTTIRAWPSRIVKPLFDKCKDMSQLDEKPRTKEELRKAIKELQRQLDSLESEQQEDPRPTSA